jgi:hypothetical protein
MVKVPEVPKNARLLEFSIPPSKAYYCGVTWSLHRQQSSFEQLRKFGTDLMPLIVQGVIFQLKPGVHIACKTLR